MKKGCLILCAAALGFSMTLAVADPVCQQLNDMIQKHQQAYNQEQATFAQATVTKVRSQETIGLDQHELAVGPQRIAVLSKRLAAAERVWHQDQSRLHHEQAILRAAQQTKHDIPVRVRQNEAHLVAALSSKYQDMCVMRNDDDPAQSPLALQFYP